MKTKITALLLSAALVLSGCQAIQNASNTAKLGTGIGVGGAAVGAVLGALLGGNNKGKGAAIGGAIGAVAGTTAGLIIGNKMDKAKKAAELANAEAEVLQNEQGYDYVKVTFPSGLLFGTGQDALTAAAKQDLATFANGLTNDMDLYIVGFSDTQKFKNTSAADSKVKNQQLSEKRAKSVGNYLATAGVPSSRFKAVVGQGEDSTYPTLEQNRRVEVYVYPSEDMIRAAQAEANK